MENEQTTSTEQTAGTETTAAGPVVADQESRNLSLLIWIGTIFFGFLPGLIFYLVKKDNPYVTDQAKEALNLSITVIFVTIAGTILSLILIGFLVIFAAWVGNTVICILGAIKVSEGKEFKAPFILRLVK